LGGQDTGKKAWSRLLGVSQPDVTTEGGKKKKGKEVAVDLMNAAPVKELSAKLGVAPAQVLLRWGLEQGAVLIPKTVCKYRMEENAAIFSFRLAETQVEQLQRDLLENVRENNPDHKDELQELTRLCWRSDPLRHLNFE
jgi:diketogulonate reductase-like aldo/keto reductase